MKNKIIFLCCVAATAAVMHATTRQQFSNWVDQFNEWASRGPISDIFFRELEKRIKESDITAETDVKLFKLLTQDIFHHLQDDAFDSVLERIIKLALQRGMNVALTPENAEIFTDNMRQVTKDSPNGIKDILNAIQNQQQRAQSIEMVSKVLSKDQERAKKEIDNLRIILNNLGNNQSGRAEPVISGNDRRTWGPPATK